MDLKARATSILTRPAVEWPIIAAERTSVNELMTRYAVPLAAIPAVCTFVGQTVVGMPMPLVGTFRVGVAGGLTGAIVGWALTVVGAYVGALVVEKLAPTFQSRGDTTQALKMVVFSNTPVWVAGVLNIIPVLSVIGILAGLYAIYLFYLGLPHVMHTPPAQVIPYMVVAALVSIVIGIIIGGLTTALMGIGAYGL